MRVIAGTARGRRLLPPPDQRTRPTTDRVREATFNALTSLEAIEGATVLDLFAGTGALGLEALSRGAARVTFVEIDRQMADVLEENVARVALAGATVVRSDALRWLSSAPSYDLVLLDPPYDFDQWELLLTSLDAQMLVAESNRKLQSHPGWAVVREKKYGSTVMTLLSPE